MKPSEEFLVSPIGEAVADYGESCEEASLAHDNREARLFHTEMADKHLATVERLIADREREIRSKAIARCGEWLRQRMLEAEIANDTLDADCLEELLTRFDSEVAP